MIGILILRDQKYQGRYLKRTKRDCDSQTKKVASTESKNNNPRDPEQRTAKNS